MIRTHLIQDLKDHRDDYVEVFAVETNRRNRKRSQTKRPILLDTPEKPKKQFDVIAEDEEDSNSFDLPQSLGI
ncbi:hypothetical protein MTR_6g452940 [Medicago truncatula]|uniref:Uncharacterized protein n=1 Tax=Medicago truncatula TaxID=3880 RepID=A0A072UB89_MEDTR|nr:hypothetical protein MTR_6g452940 [Medicago truncatula]